MITTAVYIVAALMFILSLAGLSKHETSRSGLTFGIAGMVLALGATIASLDSFGAWNKLRGKNS